MPKLQRIKTRNVPGKCQIKRGGLGNYLGRLRRHGDHQVCNQHGPEPGRSLDWDSERGAEAELPRGSYAEILRYWPADVESLTVTVLATTMLQAAKRHSKSKLYINLVHARVGERSASDCFSKRTVVQVFANRSKDAEVEPYEASFSPAAEISPKISRSMIWVAHPSFRQASGTSEPRGQLTHLSTVRTRS